MFSFWKKLNEREAFEKLDQIVDDSDSDTSLPQTVHAFQTAEAIRQNPENNEFDWLPLIGLIHDLGKVMMFVEGSSSSGGGDDDDDAYLPQWSIVGDTFPVGCLHSDTNIYHHFFENNPDYQNSKYNSSPFGISIVNTVCSCLCVLFYILKKQI